MPRDWLADLEAVREGIAAGILPARPPDVRGRDKDEVFMRTAIKVAVIAFVAGALASRLFIKPQVREVIKVQERIVTKWRTTEHIRTLPGATVYIGADGSTIISGPVDITRSSSGEGETNRQTIATKEPAHWVWLAGAGASTGWRTAVSIDLYAGRRVGELFGSDIGIVASVGLSPAAVPKRVGLALITAW